MISLTLLKLVYMTHNKLSQSDTSLEEAIKTSRKGLAASQVSGPFIISQLDPQSVSHRQHSSSAHWSNVEKQMYSVFVSYFRELMKEENEAIRNWSIFKGMSRFVKTRNPQQCRSQHLKLIKEFKGISRFILMVMERLPRLKEKMEEYEQELSQIQLQFNLYLGEESLGNLYSIKEHKLYDQQEDGNQIVKGNLNDKTDKQQLIKTSDSYFQQQHPVNSNNNQFSIFSSRSQFKPFPHFKPKTNRSSLPSFGDQPTQPNQANPQPKPQSNQNLNQISFPHQFQSSQFQNLSSPRQKFSVLSDNFDSSKDQDKGIQKMKQFLQCHYLFQLWTSKLEKIMRDS